MSAEPAFKDQVAELTDRIVQTYRQVGSIQHLGHCPLPRYDVIVSVLRDLKEILYPGFRSRERLHDGNVIYHVGNLVDELLDKLSTQIARALRHEQRLQQENSLEPCDADYQARGQTLAVQFLDAIPRLRSVLATDVQAAYDGDPACKNLDEVVFCYPGLEAITVHRLAHELYRLEIPFIPRMMAEWSHKETGIDIHPGAQIGNHFFIDHGTGVVIGETCQIGDHVKIYQGVTLGALSFPKDANGNLIRESKRHPTIEDHVVIYANSTILGGKTVIGRDSVIGSNCWITASVAPHTTVLMEKPKLRLRSGLPDELSIDMNYQI